MSDKRDRRPGRTIAVVVWVIFLVFVAHVRATNEQNEARRYWGQAITTKITGYGNIPDVYNVWSYDFTFTGHDGKKVTWNTLLRPNKPIGTRIILWQATDGNVFVRNSFNADHKWWQRWWRNSPWPVTQGTYFQPLFWLVALPLLLLWLIPLIWRANWFHRAMLYLGLLDEEDAGNQEVGTSESTDLAAEPAVAPSEPAPYDHEAEEPALSS